MKKSLLALALGALILPQVSLADTVDFTYGTEPYDGFGSAKKETYDVAIFLPGASFKDTKVSKVSVPLVKTNSDKFDADTVYVWLSKALALENKVNAPDIANYEVIRTENTGMIDFTLPEQYEITEEGVYVGYSFSMKELRDNDAKYPVTVGTGSSNPDGLFIHGSKTYLNWNSYAEKYGCSSRLTVALEADFPAVAVAPVSIPRVIYATLGETTVVNGSFNTSGTEDIKSLDIEYTIGDITGISHCEFPEAIPAGLNKKFTAQFELPAYSEKMSVEASFRVVKVNGVENTQADNAVDAVFTVVNVVPKHLALLEEYTGTWCGWCVLGFGCLEYIKETYPEFVAVAYHNGDPMTVTDDYPSYVDGFPCGYLNRSQKLGFGPESGYEISAQMQAISEEITPWYIDVTQEWESENVIKANVKVSCLNKIVDGDYRIGYIFVSDGMYDPSWQQSNYLPSQGYTQNSSYPAQVNMFCKGGVYGTDKVSGLTYNDVVISATGIKGVANSIPSEMEAETMVEHSMTLNLSKVSVMSGHDIGNVRVVAFVVDGEGNILNCAKTTADNANPALESAEPVAASDLVFTPAEDTEDGLNQLSFMAYPFDTEGEPIPYYRMKYMLIVDGLAYTFSPEEYPSIEEDMTMVPYAFNAEDAVVADGPYHQVSFYGEDFKTVGIEVLYMNEDGSYTPSDRTTINVLQTGVAVNAADSSVAYYDLSGRRVMNPEKGIYIVRAAGKTYKAIIK